MEAVRHELETWRIELFGGLRVVRGDHRITRFRTQKTELLLAYLAYYPQRPHSRERLIDLLWPESELSSGRQSLSQALSSLRLRLMPPDATAEAVIDADRAFVRLDPAAIVTDVAEFEAALQAAVADGSADKVSWLVRVVDLYQGELLAGYYEEWILRERDALAERYFQAARQLIALLESAGDLSRALQYARLVVGFDPLQEGLQRTLIRLLAATGEPAAALRQYRRFERLLSAELGVAPDDETRALAEELAARPSASLAVARAAAEEPEALSEAPRLPLRLTRFFGREEEMARLLTLLAAPPDGESGASRQRSSRPRLVTLTGPAGSGKTRLAVEVTERLAASWGGAVWFVPLADLDDPRSIPEAIRDALALPRSPGIEPLDQVSSTLAGRPALLLLDNAEHLAVDGAMYIRGLFERVPGLTCLVTSRQRLRLDGEREFPVLPLPTPDAHERLETLSGCASVQLFVDRARAFCPEFEVTQRNATAIAEMCRRLEGIPLALELAAARVPVLPPAQMLAHLDRRLDLLVTRQRDTPARHRTLRAAVEWSYRLLSPELQRFFARLSVFRGGWTEAAAAAVCVEPANGWQLTETDLAGDPPSLPDYRAPRVGALDLPPTPEVLDCLEQLRECWLVLAEPGERRLDGPTVRHGVSIGGGPAPDTDGKGRPVPGAAASGARGDGAGEIRFRMLETLRAFAREQLSPGERAALERRHAEYFVGLIERVHPDLHGPDQAIWWERLERERENLRAAGDWSVRAGGVEAALRYGAALWFFWHVQGDAAEGRRRLAEILALPSAPEASPHRARALHGAGILAFDQGDLFMARAYYEASLPLRQASGDRLYIAWLFYDLGVVTRDQDVYPAARSFQEEALAIFRELEEPLGISAALHMLGSLAYLHGDYGTARALLEESLAIKRPLDDKLGIATSLHGLGDIAGAQGEYALARALLEEERAIYAEVHHLLGVGWATTALADVAADLGEWDRTRALCEESLQLQQEVGNRQGVADLLWRLGRLKCAQGEPTAGRPLLEESLAISREHGLRRCQAAALHHLGVVDQAEGDIPSAGGRQREALALRWEIGDRLAVAQSLEGVAAVAGAEGDLPRAVRLLGSAEALREALGAPQPPSRQGAHAEQLAGLRAALGETAFAAAWAAGQAMGWEDAVAEALAASRAVGDLEPTAAPPPEPPPSGALPAADLSDAQWEALRALLPSPHPRGRRRSDPRRALDGIFYVFRTGCRWRDLPRRYGSPATCWRRLTEWQANGTWERVRDTFLATLHDPSRLAWEQALHRLTAR